MLPNFSMIPATPMMVQPPIKFCGVPISPINMDSSKFPFEQIQNQLAQLDEAARSRAVLESFYTKQVNDGAYLLHSVAINGLDPIIAQFVLSLLKDNPLCPAPSSSSLPTLRAQTELLGEISDFGFSALTDDMIRSLPHPLSLRHEGKPPLLVATERGHADLIRTFLAFGADVNQVSNIPFGMSGITALHAAMVSVSDGSNVTRALLDSQHIHINARTANGCTPLYLAVQRQLMDNVQLLYNAGADINDTPTGECMLGVPASHLGGHVEAIANTMGWTSGIPAIHKYLLTLAEPTVPAHRRLDIFARHEESLAGILITLTKQHHTPELITSLLELADRVEPPNPHPTFTSRTTNAPSPIAVCRDAGGAARLLTARNNMGSTALFIAVQLRRTEAAKAILKYNTSLPHINRVNISSGSTLLHEILKLQTTDPRIVALLLEMGADLNIINDEGHTPLLGLTSHHPSAFPPNQLSLHVPPYSIQNGDGQDLQVLLDCGADLNQTNPRDGSSVGHYIIKSRPEHVAYEMIRKLLAEGLDPEILDNEGLALIHTAASKGANSIVSLLVRRSNPNIKITPSSSFSERGNGHAGQTFVHLFTDTYQQNVNSYSALAELGCDLNAQDAMGNTPLHSAVGGLLIDKTRKLLLAGCDPTVRNNRGDTPLAMAERLLRDMKSDALAQQNTDIMSLPAPMFQPLQMGGQTLQPSWQPLQASLGYQMDPRIALQTIVDKLREV